MHMHRQLIETISYCQWPKHILLSATNSFPTVSQLVIMLSLFHVFSTVSLPVFVWYNMGWSSFLLVLGQQGRNDELQFQCVSLWSYLTWKLVSSQSRQKYYCPCKEHRALWMLDWAPWKSAMATKDWTEMKQVCHWRIHQRPVAQLSSSLSSQSSYTTDYCVMLVGGFSYCVDDVRLPCHRRNNATCWASVLFNIDKSIGLAANWSGTTSTTGGNTRKSYKFNWWSPGVVLMKSFTESCHHIIDYVFAFVLLMTISILGEGSPPYHTDMVMRNTLKFRNDDCHNLHQVSTWYSNTLEVAAITDQNPVNPLNILHPPELWNWTSHRSRKVNSQPNQ